jgi:hypothetical protein
MPWIKDQVLPGCAILVRGSPVLGRLEDGRVKLTDVVNGVAHDTSFSSVVRTTRNEELNRLVGSEDIGALPLSQRARKQRLRFLDSRPLDLGDGNTTRVRSGFVLES